MDGPSSLVSLMLPDTPLAPGDHILIALVSGDGSNSARIMVKYLGYKMR